MAIPFIFPSVYFWEVFAIGNWFTFGFIAMMLLSLGVIWACFKISSIKELLFYATAAIVVQHMVYSIARSIRFAFHIESGLHYQIVIVAIFFIIYTLFYLIFVRRFQHDNIAGVRSGHIIAFMFFASFFVYIFGLWTGRNEPQTLGSYIFDLFCCVLLLLLHFGMFERSKLEKENEIMIHLLHLEKEKHTLSAENIEIINMKYHDLIYQISELKLSTNSDKQKETINELEMATTIYGTSVKTDNEALDVLLSERSLFWSKHNINFTCIADGSKLNFMSPSDTYSIFGNALDNAIESVKKIDDEEKRIISLKVISKGNYVIINISNYFEHEIVFENGLPVTTKSDNLYHGYGIKSIKYLTEKYGGTMSIQSENDIFKLNIIIPIKEEKAEVIK
ncbi:MAG: ATP-binding protein [Anaerolineaceae bacterium]|nr:ATP-binding protein [Anaerolineaceae bacterium]